MSLKIVFMEANCRLRLNDAEMKCCILQHLIWVFTFASILSGSLLLPSTPLLVSENTKD